MMYQHGNPQAGGGGGYHQESFYKLFEISRYTSQTQVVVSKEVQL
jgi:hypothetical protein